MLFWPHATDPLNRLSVTLSRVRAAAPGALESDHRNVWTDVVTDAALLLEALDDRRDEQAIALYQGRFLNGVYVRGLSEEVEEWMVATGENMARRVQRALLSTGEEIAEYRRFGLAAAKAEAALDLGISLLQADDLIRAHALLLAGDSPRADMVQKESAALGIAVAESKKDAKALIDAKIGRAFPTNLQPHATSFFGRAKERMELERMLALPSRRLVTLVGPGGIGKTRLALQVASEQRYAPRFADGAYFVALDGAASADEIPARLADALDLFLPPEVETATAVSRAIGRRRMLVVLDNCEHLPEAGLAAARLMRDCPNLKLLATSRDRLAVKEEWLFPVPGMSGPADPGAASSDGPGDAVELFEARAQRTQASFRVQPDDLPHIADICRATGGSPLALELAAAHLSVMSVAEVAAEIAANLDFLEATSRNALDRHRSLRTVFDHSWDALEDTERECLGNLSVFRGGFRRDGARDVAGATFSTLGSTADCGWTGSSSTTRTCVRLCRGPSDPETRGCS